MGVLDDMLAGDGGSGQAPRPASGIGDVIGRAVVTPRRDGAQAPPPTLETLLPLSDGELRTWLRYLPAEVLPPMLSRASVAVAQRVVGILDQDAQTWLASQSEEIERTTEAAHATAVQRALAVLARLREDGKLTPTAAPAAKSVPRPPPRVDVAFAVPATGPSVAPIPAPAAPTPAPVQASAPAVEDDITEVLAVLVTLARGRDPAQLAELAGGIDHPVLTEGLRLVAAGSDPHDIDAALRIAGADWLAEQSRRVELIRQAVLAIRFGEGPERFRDGASRR